MDVYVTNESSALTDAEAWNVAWACDFQAQYHFGRSGWRSDVRCIYLPAGANAKVPAGGSVLRLLDTTDQQGALGYHDENGNEIPGADVFVKTAQQAGDEPSEVASHELLELAVDPHVNLSALTGDGKRLYALEVGDPVQGTGYGLNEPHGGSGGLKMANFALPAYFDPNTTTERVDFCGVLKGPFTLTSGGYMSYIDLANLPAGWQQEFGQARSELPPWAGRPQRRKLG